MLHACGRFEEEVCLPKQTCQHAALCWYNCAAERAYGMVHIGLGPQIPAACPLAGLHEAAVSLAESIYTGTRLTRALEQTFASQAAHCARLQLQSAASSSRMAVAAGGASPYGTHAGLGFADAGDGMEEDAGFGEGGMEAGLGGLAGDGLPDGEEWEARDASSGGGMGSVAATAAWRHLKQQLARFEGGEHGVRLRLLIIESALAIERRLGLPPWLLAPFKVGAPPWLAARQHPLLSFLLTGISVRGPVPGSRV